MATAQGVTKSQAGLRDYRFHFFTWRTDSWLPRERTGEGRVDWEFVISRCKLLYTEWMKSKDLLYSTGNYIQYPVINHEGREDICVCVCIPG